jgi:hypothetical protein
VIYDDDALQKYLDQLDAYQAENNTEASESIKE